MLGLVGLAPGPITISSSGDPFVAIGTKGSCDTETRNADLQRYPATGAKHLGNYIGAIRNYVATQEQGEAFFCIVDLHSITTTYEPEELREATLVARPRSSSRPGSTRTARPSSCRAT